MKLTATKVRSISEPGKYIDQHGLILRVAPGGSKQWVWRGTIHGKRTGHRPGGGGLHAVGRGPRDRVRVPAYLPPRGRPQKYADQLGRADLR